jgi:hypothetical protein
MNNRILIISGIILIMLISTISIPVLAEPNDTGILGRTHIRAIGRFHICEDDGGLYGHILFGFIGLKPVLNLDIQVCEESIKWIVLAGFIFSSQTGIYPYLNCVIKQ